MSIGTPYRPPATTADAWLAAYSTDPASIAAVADAITGASPARGHLPVAVNSGDVQLSRGWGVANQNCSAR